MRRESDPSGAGPIKECRGRVDNLADKARLEKINHLRKSVAENTYQLSAADLAEKIIDHMLHFE
jgi:hypothetical protein